MVVTESPTSIGQLESVLTAGLLVAWIGFNLSIRGLRFSAEGLVRVNFVLTRFGLALLILASGSLDGLDTGWRLSIWGSILLACFLFLFLDDVNALRRLIRLRRRRREMRMPRGRLVYRRTLGLEPIRRLFVVDVILALWFYSFALPAGDGRPSAWAVGAVAGAYLVAIVGSLWVRGHDLDTSSEPALRRSFNRLNLYGNLLLLLPTLMATTLAKGSWAGWLGLVVSAIIVPIIAPIQREIRRRQERISASGSSLSLEHALADPSIPPSPFAILDCGPRPRRDPVATPPTSDGTG